MSTGSTEEAFLTSTMQALGTSIPLETPHALSVSLPTWQHNVGWASGNPSIVNAMSTGYPRFFIHRSIQRLADQCLKRFGLEGESAMLFPTGRAANEGLMFMSKYAVDPDTPFRAFRVVALPVNYDNSPVDGQVEMSTNLPLHILLFPTCKWKFAKRFWQHTGMGISSRYAEEILAAMNNTDTPNSKISMAHSEKLAIRETIANLLRDQAITPGSESLATANDIYLYPTGMSAIWHIHQLTLSLFPGKKSACFGFSYTDTMKVLNYWGPGCHTFFDHPQVNQFALEELLASLGTPSTVDEHSPPISAVFTEFPSNPLLQSPNLPWLRKLADTYGFLIVLDDTIGNFVNVDVLPYVDVIMTSLSKLFSGAANVMGGSLALNPKSRHYERIKSILEKTFVDDYYFADAIAMELNSRDFATRVPVINHNTVAVCEFLRSRSLALAGPNSASPSPECGQFVIKEVFYPKWITRQHYDSCRRLGTDNFGPLFSLTFTSPAASHAFYDNLACAKGPSLGTNFTLACPYTILAHYHEREWAAGFGIEEGIVRVSVGMEAKEVLLTWFENALRRAEDATC